MRATDIARNLHFEFFTSASEVEVDQLEACVDIIEETAGSDYKNSSIGWNRSDKLEEMKDKDMMYLFIRKSDAHEDDKTSSWPHSILGFLSFMFTRDDPPHQDREVVYIYEIHLHESLRGQGLGSRLIEVVETTAQLEDVSKTMLTVFTNNLAAEKLYRKLGYVKDACSPEDKKRKTREVEKIIKADYMIMSKEL
ncbi:acyl-CoA N-acyltransferase [Setomelanomma holmii]|uniref:N-alpha-acetyltransferase 40 n=1 Tax=Setomelanomma holmii TaxID=210430 RepID=A0A9P4LNI8_9PLEO|nr:acyl-CoA N-acyltransferase [Setomelanomma holmii]